MSNIFWEDRNDVDIDSTCVCHMLGRKGRGVSLSAGFIHAARTVASTVGAYIQKFENNSKFLSPSLV